MEINLKLCKQQPKSINQAAAYLPCLRNANEAMTLATTCPEGLNMNPEHSADGGGGQSFVVDKKNGVNFKIGNISHKILLCF